jgi:hypothetical protein
MEACAFVAIDTSPGAPDAELSEVNPILRCDEQTSIGSDTLAYVQTSWELFFPGSFHIHPCWTATPRESGRWHRQTTTGSRPPSWPSARPRPKGLAWPRSRRYSIPSQPGARKKGRGGSDTGSRPGHEHGRPGADGFTGCGSFLTSAACPGGAPPHHEKRSRWRETATRRPPPKAGSRLVP